METKESILYNIKHLSQLVFEVTDACNLNCKYCGLNSLYKNNSERKGKKLPFYKAKLIIDYLFSLRERPRNTDYPLNLGFYGGEPLLNMKLIKQIVSYLGNINFTKATYGMTTNGMLLNKHLDYLVQDKFQLLISLDGDKFHHSYRVDHKEKNSFERVVKNIQLIKKEFPEYFKEFVQFNTVLHDRNNVEEVYNFIKKLFDKIPFIIPLKKVGVHEDRITEFKLMYRSVSESFMQSKNRKEIEHEMFSIVPQVSNLNEYIFHNIRNIFHDFNDLIFDSLSKTTKLTGTCSPFSKKMFIAADGKILQCEKIAHDFVLGQIMNDHVEIDLDSIAEKQNYYISKCKDQCKRCYFKDNCPQCIYNIQDIRSEIPKCSDYCSEKHFAEYKNITISYLRENPQYYERILKELTRK